MSNCYKCHPNGYFKESIFYDTRISHFCFDLHKRPVIHIVPKMHYNQMIEISAEVLKEIFNDLHQFVKLNNIVHYQISFNENVNTNNNHFYVKLKFDPVILSTMYHNHYDRIQAEKTMRNSL